MGTPLLPITRDALNRLQRNTTLFGERFPTVGQGTDYVLAPNDNWLASFWPGLLWLAYGASGQDVFRVHAEALLPSFVHRLDAGIHITHDLGFLYTLVARAQWQLTGDERARQLALRAAEALAARYHPVGGYIQAWGPVGDPDEGGRMIIDTMMNIHLLFWAAAQTGQQCYQRIACDHADRTAEYIVRNDSSTAHTFFFDQATGNPIGPQTHQGYSNDSMWARGQAWAIFGFATAAQWTGSTAHRDLALRLMDRFLAELPGDHVPRWDLRLPPDAPQYPDTSAGAIAAAGMLRLASQLDEAAGASVRAQVNVLLDALIGGFWETDPTGQGLLRGGTYHALKQVGVNEYFICGDYFFLEALLQSGGRCPDLWGPTASPH